MTSMALMAAAMFLAPHADGAARRTGRAQAPTKTNVEARFDLECSGMMHPWSADPSTSWKETFRVDTRSNRWCRGRCGATHDIVTMDDDRLVFHDSHAGTGGPPGVETVITRMDGEIKERLMIGTPAQSKIVVEGFCTRMPFSGFGERKF